jgi:ZIP family zinc transporter
MLASFAWGFIAASTLILGGAFALRYRVGERALGMIMAFASGVLISAVAFELVQEGFNKAGGKGAVALGLCAGSLTFFTGDFLIDRMGGADRKHSGGL